MLAIDQSRLASHHAINRGSRRSDCSPTSVNIEHLNIPLSTTLSAAYTYEVRVHCHTSTSLEATVILFDDMKANFLSNYNNVKALYIHIQIMIFCSSNTKYIFFNLR